MWLNNMLTNNFSFYKIVAALLAFITTHINYIFAETQIQDQPKTPDYYVVMSEESFIKIIQYKQEIFSNPKLAGAYLKTIIQKSSKSLSEMSNAEFIELILATKKPSIFAEAAIKGGGKDWNNRELGILGDINITMPVTIYDNGVWPSSNGYPPHFRQHKQPFQGELLFTPGALLKKRKDFDGLLPDLAEVTNEKGQIDQKAYNKLVKRRLLPILAYANEQAGIDEKQAVITMPGVGSGAFAGDYKGTIGNHLNIAMKAILKKHWSNLQNIIVVHYDPFTECDNEQQEFGNIKYRVRPASKGNQEKAQLSRLSDLEEQKEEFKNAKLYKIVAWDHVSLPGNDFIAGSKWTDDGIAGGGTNAMEKLMGKTSHYDKKIGQYIPPKGYTTWEHYANKNGIHLYARDNVKIVDSNGKIYQLKQYEALHPNKLQ